ncbi:unnamed protein product [Gemmataceae bacterium]|nr:unnamed protein product [Gemmataceae bacterium]VTU02776.1 unnamed protein product [Gemmataceae bacterium]
MITGFQATMKVDDAGTGAAAGGASTAFSGLVTFNLPAIEAGTFDATELNQDDGGTPTPAPDPWERELPTGLKKAGPVQAEMKYTKANYNRLVALAGTRGYTFVLVTPDDQTTPGTPVKLTLTFTGFIKKVDAVKFEKTNPVSIPFEVVVSKKPTYS